MVTENNNKTGFIGAINSQWLKICEAIIWKEYFSGLICCLFYTQTNIIWYSINKNSPCILQLQVSIFERRRATSFTIAAASSPDWSWGPKTSSIRGWPARFRSTRTLQNVLESLITHEHDTLFINSYLWNWSMTIEIVDISQGTEKLCDFSNTNFQNNNSNYGPCEMYLHIFVSN